MSDWKKRLNEEFDETNKRLNKLEDFLNSDEFDLLCFEDQQLLYMQKSTMDALSVILGNRAYRSTLS